MALIKTSKKSRLEAVDYCSTYIHLSNCSHVPTYLVLTFLTPHSLPFGGQEDYNPKLLSVPHFFTAGPVYIHVPLLQKVEKRQMNWQIT